MFSWRIFSPLSFAETTAIVHELDQKIDQYMISHDHEGRLGFAAASRTVISAEDLAKILGGPVKDALVTRLRNARSSIVIENPPWIESDPLQVSIVTWLLKKSGHAIIDWGGMTAGGEEIETCEEGLKNVAAFKDVGDLDDPIVVQGAAYESKPEQAEEEKDSFCAAVLESLETAMEDPEIKMDLSAAIGRSSLTIRRFFSWIIEANSARDEEAQKTLQLETQHWQAMRQEVSVMLSDLGILDKH